MQFRPSFCLLGAWPNSMIVQLIIKWPIAQLVAKSMPFEPDNALWGALLGGSFKIDSREFEIPNSKNKYWVWEWDPAHKGTLTCLNKLHCPGTNWQAPSKNLPLRNSSFTHHKASIKPAHVIFFWLTTSHTEMLQWATSSYRLQ